MDPTHPYFPDGLNMLSDDFDLSGPAETVAGPSGSGATPTSRTKSKRLTSDVCQCFAVVEMTLLECTVGPRAKCKFCPKNYTTSKGGTGHSRRHMEKCMPKHVHVPTTTQTQLQRHLDGSVMTWHYDAAHARDCLARYTAQTDQLINFGFYNMKLAESGCPPAQSLTPDDWEDDMLSPTVVAMETKFKKYWFDGVDTEPSAEPDTQPLPTSWSILKRRKKDKSASSSSSTTRSAASSGAEQNRFLEAQFDADENIENFDLLLWWKTYSYMYPVLSHLACDILVIPVSNVSSEYAFSTSGRIIEPRRNCLTPEMVEVLICVRDWKHARKRMQNETVDEQFIQNFSNLYVDEGSGSNQVQN
ncbi:hypothetical protein Dsin_001228 [Dipteronia sinensis]|uniref:C2H2-type domain-containing protein n=1 Tax=Dipteronia sinensis TaxID=43782 RepID=A0AAE0B4R1_9ROSI|nr:hypothetical protein Dsin_001228 [Dipteronia sinensis]